MRSKSAEKVKLSSFDDLFGKEEPVSGMQKLRHWQREILISRKKWTWIYR